MEKESAISKDKTMVYEREKKRIDKTVATRTELMEEKRAAAMKKAAAVPQTKEKLHGNSSNPLADIAEYEYQRSEYKNKLDDLELRSLKASLEGADALEWEQLASEATLYSKKISELDSVINNLNTDIDFFNEALKNYRLKEEVDAKLVEKSTDKADKEYGILDTSLEAYQKVSHDGKSLTSEEALKTYNSLLESAKVQFPSKTYQDVLEATDLYFTQPGSPYQLYSAIQSTQKYLSSHSGHIFHEEGRKRYKLVKQLNRELQSKYDDFLGNRLVDHFHKPVADVNAERLAKCISHMRSTIHRQKGRKSDPADFSGSIYSKVLDMADYYLQGKYVLGSQNIPDDYIKAIQKEISNCMKEKINDKKEQHTRDLLMKDLNGVLSGNNDFDIESSIAFSNAYADIHGTKYETADASEFDELFNDKDASMREKIMAYVYFFKSAQSGNLLKDFKYKGKRTDDLEHKPKFKSINDFINHLISPDENSALDLFNNKEELLKAFMPMNVTTQQALAQEVARIESNIPEDDMKALTEKEKDPEKLKKLKHTYALYMARYTDAGLMCDTLDEKIIGLFTRSSNHLYNAWLSQINKDPRYKAGFKIHEEFGAAIGKVDELPASILEKGDKIGLELFEESQKKSHRYF